MPCHDFSPAPASSVAATFIALSTGMAKPIPCAGPHRHVDADHLAVDVHQRAARIAWVDRRGYLNQVIVVLGIVDLHAAVQRADDARGYRVRIAEGIADGDHVLARHEVRRRAQRDHRHLGGGIDLDQGEVGLSVAGDDRSNVLLALGGCDLDFADAVHNVEVGEDVAARIDHDARAHAVDAAGGFGIRFLRRGEHGLFAANAHDRGNRLLCRLDDGRETLVGAGGNARQQRLGNRRRQKESPGGPQDRLGRSVEHGGSCRRRCDNGLGCFRRCRRDAASAETLLLDRKCRTKRLTGIISTGTDCADRQEGLSRKAPLSGRDNCGHHPRALQVCASPLAILVHSGRKNLRLRICVILTAGVPTVTGHARQRWGIGRPKLDLRGGTRLKLDLLGGNRLNSIGQEDWPRGHRMEPRIFRRFGNRLAGGSLAGRTAGAGIAGSAAGATA